MSLTEEMFNTADFFLKSSTPNGIIDFVIGPMRATHQAIALFNGTSGQLLQNSDVCITPSGELVVNNGVVTAPTYSFKSDTSSGVCLLSSGKLGFVTNGQPGMVLDEKNVVLHGMPPSDYGDGKGCTFINNCETVPQGVPNHGCGGILFVNGNHLCYLNSHGKCVTLNNENAVTGQIKSRENTVALWSGTNCIKDSAVTISSDGFMQGVDGHVGNPTYSFLSDVSCGMYLLQPTCLGFSSSGTTNIVLTPHGNVSLAGGCPMNYGATTSGKGVIYINAATTVPSGVPNGGSGGILYVSGKTLHFLNAAGVACTLGGASGTVVGPVVSTNRAITLFNGMSGQALQNSIVTISTTGSICGPNGTVLTPAYSFTNDTKSGMYLKNKSEVGVAANCTDALVVSEHSNVSLGGGPPSTYGSAEGVVFINECSKVPQSEVNDGKGGLLYVSESTLCYEGGGVKTIVSCAPCMFYGTLDTTAYTTLNTNMQLKFNNVVDNTELYDSAMGCFIAPVQGVYSFSVSMKTTNNSMDAGGETVCVTNVTKSFEVMRSGLSVCGPMHTPNAFLCTSLHCVTALNKGDEVAMFFNSAQVDTISYCVGCASIIYQTG